MHPKLRFPKRTTIVIFCALICYVTTKAQSVPDISANHLVLPAKSYSIPFYWQGDSINLKWDKHTALLLPVKLKNCPRQFFMQFDLGSPYSIFYKNKLMAIQAKYPNALLLKESDEKLDIYSFKIGKMPVLAKQIIVKQFDSSGINWMGKGGVEIIGTIGADLIDGKVAVIDYPNQTLTLSDTIAKEFSDIAFTDFIYTNRRVLLPSKLRGKQTILYFDTGSSMFELLTNKETCTQLAIPNASPTQFKIESWGKTLIANSLPSNGSIYIANTVVPIHSVSYIEGISNSQVEQMLKMGIGGMTGNKLFLDYKLILDTKNKKVGLVRSN